MVHGLSLWGRGGWPTMTQPKHDRDEVFVIVIFKLMTSDRGKPHMLVLLPSCKVACHGFMIWDRGASGYKRMFTERQKLCVHIIPQPFKFILCSSGYFMQTYVYRTWTFMFSYYIATFQVYVMLVGAVLLRHKRSGDTGGCEINTHCDGAGVFNIPTPLPSFLSWRKDAHSS